MDRLLPGDIVLTREEPSGKSFKELKAMLQSRVIRYKIKGNYSHVMMYVGSGSYIHSDLKGVHAGSINRCIFNSPNDVKILRTVAVPVQINKAIEFVRNQVGKEYDVKEAVGAIYSKLKGKDNRQFCSRLIAQAFEYAGVKLTSDADKSTPACIEKSGLAYKPFYAVRTQNLEEQNLLDEGSVNLESQIKITNELLKSARELTNKDIQTIEELLKTAINFSYLDGKLANLISSSGFLDIYEHEIDKNTYRYDIHDAKTKFSMYSHEYISHICKAEIKATKDNYPRYSSQYMAFIQLKQQRPQNKCLSLMVDLYKKLTSYAVRNQQTMVDLQQQVDGARLQLY